MRRLQEHAEARIRDAPAEWLIRARVGKESDGLSRGHRSHDYRRLGSVAVDRDTVRLEGVARAAITRGVNPRRLGIRRNKTVRTDAMRARSPRTPRSRRAVTRTDGFGDFQVGLVVQGICGESDAERTSPPAAGTPRRGVDGALAGVEVLAVGIVRSRGTGRSTLRTDRRRGMFRASGVDTWDDRGGRPSILLGLDPLGAVGRPDHRRTGAW